MTPRHFALALGLAVLLCPPAFALDRAAVFDAHAAQGLPTHFTLPSDGGEQSIALLRKLGTEVEVNGIAAAIYLAEVDGRRGTAVRLGKTLEFTFEDEENEAAERAGAPGDADTVATERLPQTLARGGVSVRSAGTPAKTLDVWVFLHDAAGESNHAKFLGWYATWWIEDMEGIVGPGVPVRVFLRDRIQGITDMDYHAGRPADRLRDLATRGRQYARWQGHEVTDLTEFVMFVDEPAGNWSSGVLGLAAENYGSAIASNRGHRHIFAHEVGHLLGARHEDAERGFFCITNMKDNLWGAISCRKYSAANRARIRKHVLLRKDD